MDDHSNNNNDIYQEEEEWNTPISKHMPFPKVLSQYQVPRDPEDPRYVLSFNIETESEKMMEFFRKFGFVVARQALSPDDCEVINAHQFVL